MTGHHLILGKLSDVLTGETLDDTLDERYRQKIARLLVERGGDPADEIEPRRELLLQADDRRAVIKVDFVVRIAGKAAMVIRFGPGSIVSRERPTLAVSRLVEAYQVPLAVVTNGEDAEILDGGSGKVVGRGLGADRPRRIWRKRSGIIRSRRSPAKERCWNRGSLTVTRSTAPARATTRYAGSEMAEGHHELRPLHGCSAEGGPEGPCAGRFPGGMRHGARGPNCRARLAQRDLRRRTQRAGPCRDGGVAETGRAHGSGGPFRHHRLQHHGALPHVLSAP